MGDNGKLLTVVVPTYNMEKYLPECLDSVTADIVSDRFEVIVVNDGSKDSSLEIARRYESKRPDIVRVIDKENGNYGSCVNAGLAVATGKYFRMLDADDRFDTDALVELLQRLEICDTDLVVTLITEEVYHNERKVDEIYHPFSTVKKNHVYKTDEFYIHTHVFDGEFRMHGLTYKTEVLRRSGLHLIEGISYTDTIYLYQPFAYAKDFIVYDLYLYHYRIGREGQTMDPEKQRKGLIDIARVVELQLDELDKTPQEEHLKTNQKALIMVGGISFFLDTLKMQRGLPKECYALFHSIISRINKYGISPRPLKKKWYFKLWEKTESSRVLDVALRLRSIFN